MNGVPRVLVKQRAASWRERWGVVRRAKAASMAATCRLRSPMEIPFSRKALISRSRGVSADTVAEGDRSVVLSAEFSHAVKISMHIRHKSFFRIIKSRVGCGGFAGPARAPDETSGKSGWILLS